MDKTCYNCGTPIAKAYCEDWPEVCEHWKPKKPPTNADRIRAMSDEELASFFPSTASEWSCHPGATTEDCGRVGGWFEGCPRCWLDWLKSPVEVEE